MSYVDTPEKKQKHAHYDHRTRKLNVKDNEFSSKEFHKVRKVSTRKVLLESFGRISMCLNNKSASDIPTGDLDKVCLILVNDNYSDKNYGVGPLNDGYLVCKNLHSFGYKIFYLNNTSAEKFTSFLGFFMKNTTDELTVFYSGREDDKSGIEFGSESLSKESIRQTIASNCTGKPRVMFITDCIGGGSVFDISDGSNLMAVSVTKSNAKDSKECKRTHGILTYYLFKIINESPSITVSRLAERMDPSLLRFNEAFQYEVSNKELEQCPIFFS